MPDLMKYLRRSRKIIGPSVPHLAILAPVDRPFGDAWRLAYGPVIKCPKMLFSVSWTSSKVQVFLVYNGRLN
jgi:hypothetical protein